MKLGALIRKEFFRFFHDPRLIVTMLLPGLLIFILYSVLGSIVSSDGEEDATYSFRAYLSGESQTVAAVEAAIAAGGSTVEWLPADDLEAAKREVKEGNVAALVVFSDGFDAAERPSVEIYYDLQNDESAAFAMLAGAVLQEIGARFTVERVSVRADAELGAQIMSQILPLLMAVLVFSACMSVTLEAVAGEKERGTLSTILVTSVRRSHIALAKVVALSCIASIGAASSFLGVALSMPRLMNVSMDVFGEYSAASYLLLFPLIVSTVPLIVSLISIVSAYSRSLKEASAYTSVLMIVVMVVSLVSGFISVGDWVTAIPLLNAVAVMQTILTGALPVWQALVSVGVNLLFTALAVWIISAMLSSERIMFGK